MPYPSTTTLDANAVPRLLRSVTRGGLIYPLSSVLPGPGLASRALQGRARQGGAIDATVQVANFGVNAAEMRTYFGMGNMARVRYPGPIRRVRMYLEHMQTRTHFAVMLWRFDTPNYRCVARTANLWPNVAGGIVNDLWLPVPLMAAAGDFLGFQITATGVTYDVYVATHANHEMLRISSDVPDLNGGTLAGWTSTASRYCPIEAYGDPPTFAWLGHSQAEGLPGNSSGMNVSSTWDPTWDPGAILAALLPGSTHNGLGIGGELIAATAARADYALQSSRPAYAVFLTGINDVIGGAVDFAAHAAAAHACCLSALRAGSIPVWIEMLPCSACDAAHMRTRDQFNAAVVGALDDLPVIIVNAESTLGQFRAAGDPGNLWDLIATMADGDGLHLTKLGYQTLAAAVLAALPVP